MENHDQSHIFDFVIIGAGISGSFIAYELCKAGCSCLMLEAGRQYNRQTYPATELDGSSQLYWSGGLELPKDCRTAFLRAKVVGGGSIVNQALVDRFDNVALDSWREVSGIDYFNTQVMDTWYDKVEEEIHIQSIPSEHRNRNALIFQEGFEKLGYKLAPLRRAQKDCRYEEGNCCIECLSGCPIGSKQSMPETVLKKAIELGLTLIPELEVKTVSHNRDAVEVKGVKFGQFTGYRAKNLVMAAGSVGNSVLLLNSGFGKRLKRLGHDFFCHPQYDNFGIYAEEINSHRGPFQSFCSDEPKFREKGFKLENVYAGASGIAMLIGGFGKKHHYYMERLAHFACIEVCIRDITPGQIRVGRGGKVIIKKKLGKEEKDRYKEGVGVINDIFHVTGAKEIINSKIGIGLHLMGGCSMGADSALSVVNPEFRLHGYKDIFIADSSVFPNAPGINPSLTVMALSLMAASQILRGI